MKKKDEATKDRIIRIIFDLEKEDYYKPVKLGNFWSKSYTEYESDENRNKTILLGEYLNKVRRFLKDIINDLKKSGTWKIQQTISINFNSSKDNDEERVMHSKSDYLKIIINDEADEVIKEILRYFLLVIILS